VLPDCTLSAGLPAEAQMPLPRLVPAADAVPVAVQETSLAVDALARNVCNTWQEATANGGPPFSVVVVGAGAYGGYLAAKLAEFQPQRRVLLLEAGPFLVGEHVQNLGPVGLGIPPAIDPAQDPLKARDLVWGLPWRGNTPFPGTAYCCGGKSLYWGGWCPRLTPADLARWPAPVAADLQTEYDRVESELGVVPGTDFLSGDLLAKLQGRVDAVVPGIPDLDLSLPADRWKPHRSPCRAALRRRVCSASTSTAACRCSSPRCAGTASGPASTTQSAGSSSCPAAT
jgi:hypothetical protein